MKNDAIFGQEPSSTATVPWTPRDVFWALVMSLGWILLFVLIGMIGQRIGLTIDPSLIILVGTTVLLIPTWYFSVRKYQVPWADLGIRRFQPVVVGLGCGLMILSLLFNLIYAAILSLYGMQIQPDIGIMFNNTSFPIILLIGGALVAPFVEEVFFRGFIFPGLRNRWDWKVAAVISAGLFALAHVIPTSYVPIFILGLIFAFLYQVSGSIWPSVLMHVLTNTVALTTAYAMSQGWIPTP